MPPPNVTGALHMGHALNGSIQDALIRWNRMHGRPSKWIFGTDHAGIATQKQVEAKLARDGVTKEELGRERFVEEVWKWTREHGGIIQNQFKRLGASLDYEDERFTLDEGYVRAVLKVFVDLYEQGLIYRDHYMVNWDPGLGTAVSDLEVEEREVQDTLYSIRYSDDVVIATVRPETLLGDTAVAVHPDDERYTHLVGTTVTLPLVGRELPIIADDYVKMDFGTGNLKITPGHDPNDFEIGQRHGLETVSIIGEDGRMTPEAGERFAGMTALEAREAVVEALGDAVVATEPYTHNVPYSHRSRRAHRAAHLAAVVHADGRAGRAGDRRRQARRGEDPPAVAGAPLRRVAREHPAVVHLAAALVGAPDPRLVPRARTRSTAASSRPRGTGGSATPTSSTPGSRAACGRSRRSAGRRTRPRCARSTRRTSSRRRATSSSCGWRGWSCSACASRGRSRSST